MSQVPRCPRCCSALNMDGNPPTPTGCSNEDCNLIAELCEALVNLREMIRGTEASTNCPCNSASEHDAICPIAQAEAAITKARRDVRRCEETAALKALRQIATLPLSEHKNAGQDCGNADDVFEDGYQAGLRAAAKIADDLLATEF